MLLPIDIETVPTDDPAVIAEIAAGITPPKTMSKPETIAKWEAEERPSMIEEAVKKTAFDGTYGRIVCVGWAYDDQEPVSMCGADERDLLSSFFTDVALNTKPAYTGDKSGPGVIVCGHNVAGFDLRFLWQRAVINGLKPPYALHTAMKAKPWDKTIADTMLMWSPEYGKKISLDALCRALKVESPKGDMDGSKVWDAFKAGQFDRISDYCRGDVAAVRECYRRMTFS